MKRMLPLTELTTEGATWMPIPALMSAPPVPVRVMGALSVEVIDPPTAALIPNPLLMLP